MVETPTAWPYLPTLARLALALAIGLFVGIERERRRKEAGLRTFGFVALLGALGGLLGPPFALATLGLVGILVVLLNVETIRTGEGAEITTSAALLVTACAGMLAGQGHTFTPTALGVATAGLLAWKEPLAGFSQTLTEAEIRSAVLLAILAFVVYPGLPLGSIDPWHLIEPRAAWITVILIAALGFANYVLLKTYGTRGVELTGLLGGLVNSTVAVAELADQARAAHGRLVTVIYRGVILATAAMLVRNAVILGLLAPLALVYASVPLALMIGGAAVIVTAGRRRDARAAGAGVRPETTSLPTMQSPFSLRSTLKFGILFLALNVAATLAQRALGDAGFYVVSALGGLVSSASAVAAAGNLAASGALPARVAGTGAVVAVLASVAVNLPLVSRFGRDPALTRRVAWTLGVLVLLGAVGAVVGGYALGRIPALERLHAPGLLEHGGR
ncbi:MAG: MgtC/SapB family protein [Gemmatimonadetes bacterium]|nr:MgtC/SapB family protein [Gemmatimonadota bacterium]